MSRFIIKIDKDLEDLIPGFMDNRETDILLLKEKLENNDFDPIKITGHSMKGFGAGYGFLEISEIGAKLELAAIKKDKLEIASLIEKLQNYIRSVEVVFEEVYESSDTTIKVSLKNSNA